MRPMRRFHVINAIISLPQPPLVRKGTLTKVNIKYQKLNATSFGITQGQADDNHVTRWCSLTCFIVALKALGRADNFQNNISLSDGRNFWNVYQMIFNINKIKNHDVKEVIKIIVNNTNYADMGRNIINDNKIFNRIVTNVTDSIQSLEAIRQEISIMIYDALGIEFHLERLGCALVSMPNTIQGFIGVLKRYSDPILLVFQGSGCGHCMLVDEVTEDGFVIWNPQTGDLETVSYYTQKFWPIRRRATMKLHQIYTIRR